MFYLYIPPPLPHVVIVRERLLYVLPEYTPSPSTYCIETLVKTFKVMMKVLRNKDCFYSTPRGKGWLQKELTIKEPAPEIPGSP
jgi:hypothetical protein